MIPAALVWLAAVSVALGAWWGNGAIAAPCLLASCVLFVTRRAAPAALLLACVGLGALAGAARSSERALEVLARDVPYCRGEGRVVESAGSLGLLVGLESLRCEGRALLERAGPVIVEEHLAEPGAPVRLEGYLLPLDLEDPLGRARATAGALATLEATEAEAGPVPFGPQGLAAALRRGMRNVAAPLGRPGALLLGLTIGDTDRLDRTTIERFRRSGLSHLLAVSGSNVAIVVGAASLAARHASLRARIFAGGLVLGIYVLVVGPEPSVLRAAATGGVALAAIASGRVSEPLQALGLAVAAVVALRPAIVRAVGLHLSVAATAGIVLFAAPIAERLTRLPRVVALAAGVALGAQLAVLPILMVTFGEVSLVSPLANLLAAPAVPPATVLGLAAGLVGTVHPALGGLLARAAEPFSRAVLAVADIAGSSPHAAVSPPRWSAAAAGGALLVASVLALRSRARAAAVP